MVYFILVFACLIYSVAPSLAEETKHEEAVSKFQEILDETTALKDRLVRKTKESAQQSKLESPLGISAPSQSIDYSSVPSISSGPNLPIGSHYSPPSDMYFHSCLLSSFCTGFTYGYNAKAEIIAERSTLRATNVSRADWDDIERRLESRKRCSADFHYAFWLDKVSFTDEQISKMRAAAAQGFEKGSEAAIEESRLPRYHFRHTPFILIDCKSVPNAYLLPVLFEYADKEGIPKSVAAEQMKAQWRMESQLKN